MRTALLLSLFLVVGVFGMRHASASAEKGEAQSTAKPAAPQTAKPAGRGTQPAGRGAAPAAARAGIALLVTSPAGATLPGVRVELIGPSMRVADTNSSGQLDFTDLQAGTYRLRFTSETVTAFEREVELAAGRTATVDVSLNPAPPPREVFKDAPPPPAPPAGEARTMLITELLEKDFVGRDPRRETLLSCSGELRTMMLQLNQPLPDRLYDDADVAYYVLAGEGAIILAGRESQLRTNGFVSVPRGTVHSFTRRGNRPLVLLAVLGGTPCEEAR